MRLEVEGVDCHVATGGRTHAPGRPWVVFLHGAGSSHLAWALQTRALAYDGWNVLAPDLPGHFLSSGAPIADIGGQAQFVLSLLRSLGATRVVLVGHSMGGLIALEMARIDPEAVAAIAFVATAAAIPVNDWLINCAATDEELAFSSMTSWAHGAKSHLNDNTWPGAAHIGFGIDSMRLNATGSLAIDLKACAAYRGGAEAAANLGCPTLCVFARADRMTPLRQGLKLAELLPNNETIIVEDCGHTIPTEAPRVLNAALRRFLPRASARSREAA